MNWAEFLGIMRLDEEAAEKKYRAAVEVATDPQVKEVLERLAYEEEIHAAVLAKEQERLRSLGSKNRS